MRVLIPLRCCFSPGAAIWLTTTGAVRIKPNILWHQRCYRQPVMSMRATGVSPDRSAAIGLMFSLSLGASKELWDSRPEGSGWSWKDFVWDVAGATTGYAIWQMARY